MKVDEELERKIRLEAELYLYEFCDHPVYDYQEIIRMYLVDFAKTMLQKYGAEGGNLKT